MVELIWDGKYDENGKRVAPLKVALPFQTVETVNESAQQRQRTLEFLLQGRDPEWRNRLIWGDKKYVLPSLLPEFAGKVDLIYIDPPFATGAGFSFRAEVGDDEFSKEASVIEQKAYRDTWGRGHDSYVSWFYKTATLLYELLSQSGSLYVHIDWHMVGLVRLVLDEVFGGKNFVNELVWLYKTGGVSKRWFGRKHDTILYYSKSEKYTFNPQTEKSYLAHKYGFSNIEIHQDKLGYYTIAGMRDVWDVPALRGNQPESTKYPTQKPEELLIRIIKASSNEGDLVLDSFCGSGTTAAVAEKLNRRWIACDLGRFAIHTTRKRLLGVENVRPFIVQNLGKYERQVWQKAEFGENAALITRTYRKFILDLYHAEMVEGFTWLHGKKGRRMVHVGSVDSPVAVGDVRNIAIDFRRAIGTGKNAPGVAGVDILGWDFALDMNETAVQIAQEAGINVRFVRIPREVLEKKAVEQGDIKFFELAALDVDVIQNVRDVSIALTNFTVPLYDVPDQVVKAVHDWSEWIDYWAVDFNYRDDTFHNQWQSYRTRKNRSLLLRVNHTYDKPGDYAVLVKVIDILGNDTTKTISVKVV